MSSSDSTQRRPPSSHAGQSGGPNDEGGSKDPNPPTIAQFSKSPSAAEKASYHQIFQKSPLLASTPPQITRALSQIYPYARFLNRVAGLITWTTEDPWESFLLVATFWAIALYGDLALIWAGNLLVVLVLALGTYFSNYKSTFHIVLCSMSFYR
jgi:hypothetical protein